jgi:hypothetical protein
MIALGIIMFANSVVYSQPKKKTWELSLSGNMGTVYSTTKSESQFGSYSSSTPAHEFVTLALRPGFFITDEIQFEPEIQWAAAEGGEPLLSFSVNVAYNFNISHSNTRPFILLGYGRANSIPIFQTLIFRLSDKHDISIINVGGGFKIFAAENVAFRTEYRFQRFARSESFSDRKYKYATIYHNIFFGFSLFFKN